MAKFRNQTVKFLVEDTIWNLTYLLHYLEDWKKQFPSIQMVVNSTEDTEQQTNQGTSSCIKKITN